MLPLVEEDALADADAEVEGEGDAESFDAAYAFFAFFRGGLEAFAGDVDEAGSALFDAVKEVDDEALVVVR